MRALAEAPRILFHYTGIEFEDLIGEYTFDKMLKNVGLTTNRRK